LRIAHDSFFAQANGCPNIIVKRLWKMPSQEQISSFWDSAGLFYQPSVVVLFETTFRFLCSQTALVNVTLGRFSNSLNARHFPNAIRAETSKRIFCVNGLPRSSESLQQHNKRGFYFFKGSQPSAATLNPS